MHYIAVYGPNESGRLNEVQELYNKLQVTIDKASNEATNVGDLNARVENDAKRYVLLLEFCIEHELIITNAKYRNLNKSNDNKTVLAHW